MSELLKKTAKACLPQGLYQKLKSRYKELFHHGVVFNEVTHCLFFVLPVAKTRRSIDGRIFTFSLLGVEIIRIKKW
jgi:hypothetical protein